MSIGTARTEPSRVELYWIPLGAGQHVVRICGRIFEGLSALVQRRASRALYHSALVVVTAEGTTIIEVTPIPDGNGRTARGVVGEGAVGVRWAQRFRLFRYEIRCWRNGEIPDLAYAVASPVRITDQDRVVSTLLDAVPLVPAPVWGRDELHAGEMWNSNSVTSWLLTTVGVDAAAIHPPDGGRAPGWDAGVLVARRSHHVSDALAATRP